MVRDSFGDIFTLTSRVEPNYRQDLYVGRTAQGTRNLLPGPIILARAYPAHFSAAEAQPHTSQHMEIIVQVVAPTRESAQLKERAPTEAQTKDAFNTEAVITGTQVAYWRTQSTDSNQRQRAIRTFNEHTYLNAQGATFRTANTWRASRTRNGMHSSVLGCQGGGIQWPSNLQTSNFGDSKPHLPALYRPHPEHIPSIGCYPILRRR